MLRGALVHRTLRTYAHQPGKVNQGNELLSLRPLIPSRTFFGVGDDFADISQSVRVVILGSIQERMREYFLLFDAWFELGDLLVDQI